VLTLHDARVGGGEDGLTRGRFEAEFKDVDAAKAAARDARGVGFVVDIPRETAQGWLLIGRRRLPFPNDECERYASRVRAIATQHGGVFSRFVEEPLTHEDGEAPSAAKAR
jgi:hypothetical protein